MNKAPISVLFVCMGNICRSPTAEGVFRKQLEQAGLVGQVLVDSAGTHAYHIGNPPDSRSQAAAAKRGIDISWLRARIITSEDFGRFDYVLAMDASNLSALKSLRPTDARAKLDLLMPYAPVGFPCEVPDPYYGGREGFEKVLDMVEAACQGLLQEILQQP